MTIDIPINIPRCMPKSARCSRSTSTPLVSNDVALLDELFWDSPHGALWRRREPRRHRGDPRLPAARSPADLARTLRHTVITTYGDDFATAMTEFERPGRAAARARPGCAPMPGHGGWRVASLRT